MNTYTGRLVSIEGLDGAGSTTVTSGLQEVFGGNEASEFTQEPSEGVYGRYLRKELASDSDPTVSDFFMFCADRYDHCHSLIGPSLEKGKTVITDRYQLSTYAYQAPVLEAFVDEPIDFIDETLDDFVIEPDLTILIDIPVDVALKRVGDDTEKYEKRESLERAREIYLQQAEERDYVEVIDGTQSEEEVLEEAKDLYLRDEWN
jgi:dTMP kinase